ncbi:MULTISPECIES: hypothetical protein [unclassified Rhizobium]|uniref:hypothetical protein n=1 Tax=unclassified Rhizobium TaxID=2613769 RepID=UPI001FCDCCA8|nr:MULTISPECIES: hypothetical protein [unclassified Rhizobium]MDM9621917.1 hypothetical protein [Rhizobium sp. S96]
MMNDNVPARDSRNAAKRELDFERTSQTAREVTDAERRHRAAKTERLRVARMQAEEQGRQL